MSKRKLSRQQQFRIRKVQDERLARAQKKEAVIDESALGDARPGLVVSHYGVTTDVESDDGERTRCHKRTNLPALVTGDVVLWQPDDNNSGVITACQPRRSELGRPDSRGQMRPVAANVDRIIIVAAPSPRTPANLIDRYLVAAAHHDIHPIIVLNKIDCLDQAPEMRDELAEYQTLGYETHALSAQTEAGMAEIRQLVASGNSVFVGQSGVGKSSIIATLLPEEMIKVGEISEATGKGRHTTTTAKLYHIPGGGDLIDSPGIREFGLWHVDADSLLAGFPELANSADQCKFRDCKHKSEPGCAVCQAVEEGTLSQRRYESFLAIRDSLDEVSMREEPR
ncbi:ribosome biogenesis GTPase RsgA [Saccharospirillum sp. MSK14-1]|uniref:small ribosomal subunit biogenesis GTPase RsgA n=1 Tax=Saccharospirillum sp. MSK14-1 TaxID=1897632 RepID=UPI000D375475|nr:small ribosomal subunit biogenesis GTPase RsgA [Saccharospirillum sp. MSK14-1]PTY38653.1 ribosome biogenesis GTPase RsgA [Saccharospirillum sp. MSK14-1]